MSHAIHLCNRLGYLKLIPILIQLIMNTLCDFVLFHHESVSSHVLGTFSMKVEEICFEFHKLIIMYVAGRIVLCTLI